jgi:Cys-tRNA(Pro)/Cys-tRNA(Cys) deacylase
MTPAIKLLEKHKTAHSIHQYDHDAKSSSYGLEAAEKLAITADRVFKTLVIQIDNGELAVAIVPVNHNLNMKKAAKNCGAKKAEMADTQKVERTTGYVLGGVSPLGQKKRLRTVIDSTACQHKTIFVSAGKRGLEIELAAEDLQVLTSAVFAEIV